MPDDYTDPQRTSRGKIPLENLPPQDMNRFSFGKIGDQPLSNADFGSLARPIAAPAPAPAAPLTGPMANTRNVLSQGAQDVRDTYQQGGLGPAVGMLARASVAGVPAVAADLMPGGGGLLGGLKTFVAGKDAVPQPVAAPAAQQQAAAPAPTPAKPAPAVQGAEKAPARTIESLAYTTKDTSVPGVQRIDQKGQAPLFTNLEPAAAVAEMKGNPIGIVPAGASPFGGSGGGADVSAALQAAAERGDWASIQRYYQQGGGTWQGRTAEQDARAELLAALTPGRSGGTRRQNELLASLLNAGQQNATQQTQAQASLLDALGRRDLNGVQVQQAQQLQAAYKAYIEAKTPEEQTQALKVLQALKGTPAQDRFTVVPGGQEWDPTAGPMGAMRNVPGWVINNQTGQILERPTPAAPKTYPAGAIADLKADPKLAAAFDAKYGPGSAAAVLRGGAQ